ncbi:MAG: SOS response-associated peptidase [Bacteroidetes bacterium]|jgi:putative SOS response-associated peptidase YedK|nr:SOS response-associated peptidase [Bacteroidota bacterium]MBT6687312.1 SOS response-associated peptidase [Bacteroidota bacterium]MBT7143976.1 SOS response-associated peptidase [Bacteroidota bacterium]MBT7491111.1 SOS response-associated peptidase [Bacteroidota bacterium]
MCGRYIEVQKVEVIEKRFNIKIPNEIEYKTSYNISPGQLAPIITNEDPNILQMFKFGLTPFWAKKQMYLFNARVEGDKNKENDSNYSGSCEIVRKPAFRKPIRSRRCLVIADAFIEGTTNEGLSKPYLIYLRDKKRPFAFAGIWDSWQNSETGELVESFSIITTVANSLIQKLPHQRSPVILHQHNEKKWLNNKTPLSDIIRLLRAYPSELMNAYPITPTIKNPKAEGKILIEPIGQRIETEFEIKSTKELQLQGMGSNKRTTDAPTWGRHLN